MKRVILLLIAISFTAAGFSQNKYSALAKKAGDQAIHDIPRQDTARRDSVRVGTALLSYNDTRDLMAFIARRIPADEYRILVELQNWIDARIEQKRDQYYRTK